MKRNLKIGQILAFAGLSVWLGACESDFLDLTPVSNANEGDFYQTESEITDALPAAYATLYDIYAPSGPVYFFGALGSDDAFTTDMGGNPADYTGISNLNVRYENAEVNSAWNLFYQSLYRINNMIDRIQNSGFHEEALVYEAEMRFLRALYYFNMVRMWGGVMLVTHPVSIEEAYAMNRASEEEIYTQIIRDLEFALASLPVKGQERKTGVATKGAAWALLGKVYLTKGDKSAAAAALLNIYQEEYQLVDYAGLWDKNNKNCAESIFEIQYLGGTAGVPSFYWAEYSPANNIGAVTLQGGGHNQVSEDLWLAYEPNDPRRDISIQNGYVNLQGDPVDIKFPIKWVDRTTEYDGKREAGDNNFIVFRYADVLLMLAEATGDPKYLNEVRDRAGLPLWEDSQYPKNLYPTLASAIEHERQVELAMEFHRFFDLKRTGRAIEVMKNSWKKLTGVTENNLVWPIPQSVLDQNPALKSQQNPGYDS